MLDRKSMPVSHFCTVNLCCPSSQASGSSPRAVIISWMEASLGGTNRSGRAWDSSSCIAGERSESLKLCSGLYPPPITPLIKNSPGICPSNIAF